MTRYTDAALLKGDYAKMLKEPPKESEWKKAACDNGPEEAAQAIARQIFDFQKTLDTETEKLEVVTFAAIGPIKVSNITPIDGDMMRIDGINPANDQPVSILQHVGQLSLTFTKVAVSKDGDSGNQNDDGLQIGYVIFDELKERKKVREAAKRKKPSRKTSGRKAKS